jgi:hypothetical protein
VIRCQNRGETQTRLRFRFSTCVALAETPVLPSVALKSHVAAADVNMTRMWGSCRNLLNRGAGIGIRHKALAFPAVAADGPNRLRRAPICCTISTCRIMRA